MPRGEVVFCEAAGWAMAIRPEWAAFQGVGRAPPGRLGAALFSAPLGGKGVRCAAGYRTFSPKDRRIIPRQFRAPAAARRWLPPSPNLAAVRVRVCRPRVFPPRPLPFLQAPSFFFNGGVFVATRKWHPRHLRRLTRGPGAVGFLETAIPRSPFPVRVCVFGRGFWGRLGAKSIFAGGMRRKRAGELGFLLPRSIFLFRNNLF